MCTQRYQSWWPLVVDLRSSTASLMHAVLAACLSHSMVIMKGLFNAGKALDKLLPLPAEGEEAKW